MGSGASRPLIRIQRVMPDGLDLFLSLLPCQAFHPSTAMMMLRSHCVSLEPALDPSPITTTHDTELGVAAESRECKGDHPTEYSVQVHSHIRISVPWNASVLACLVMIHPWARLIP
ncbi:hypothetical protein BT67DRAFT_108974 [Trichocladium antarcticum]|uniref:Uncharacterized protein n=1 Tax=Trichocladium antarcticum TaxID=1450529 RepID=A0AAN6UR54_9PEZI|nr:hypothetical protein BT67DRAFT_108974 [Trichocladium antarcticum]